MLRRILFLLLFSGVATFECTSSGKPVHVLPVRECDLPKPYGGGLVQPWSPVETLSALDRDPDSLFHPARAALYGLASLDSFLCTGNTAWLNSAIAFAKLLGIHALRRSGSVFFPYRFTWFLHGERRLSLKPPWVSALSQGLALALFSRLTLLTGNRCFGTTADSIFTSFRPVSSPCSSRFWVAYTDSTGLLWLEEYPRCPNPTHVLNGYISAIYGLYEYTRLRRSGRESWEYLQRALYSLKELLPRFRDGRGLSFYCLAHRVRRADYHRLHIEQMRFLFAITLNPFFEGFRRQLVADQVLVSGS